MSDEKPTVVELTREQVLDHIRRVLEPTPYETAGQLRDALAPTSRMCCFNCIDYEHPHASAWGELGGWLYLADIDWRTCP